MSFELRPIHDDEIDEFCRVEATAFGEHPTPDWVQLAREHVEFDRTIGVFDAGRIVATAGANSFELTLPGLTTAPAAGVTAVGVLPTHRRRGLLTAMMRHQLDDVHERGEPLAVLTASESIIYGRFGYGPASYGVELEIDVHAGAFTRPLDVPGRLRMLEPDEPAKLLPEIYDRYRRAQPGELGRPPGRWAHWFYDPPDHREGASQRFFVVHEDERGRADGYAAYRTKHAHEAAHDVNRLLVAEMSAAEPAVRAALWRFCLDVDLITTVNLWNAPVDDPVRWMLADPRRLQVKVASDFLWVRVLDVCAALEVRRYARLGSLVLEVADRFRPQTSGRYRLDAGPDGAECRPTTDGPDITLDVADLGALYLGGTAATTLARAGRLREERAGAVTTADALFVSYPAPFCSTEF